MKDKEKNYEINPCQRCPLKDGYGGEYRCSICELTFLRKETERLNKKLKKKVDENSVVLSREEYEKLQKRNADRKRLRNKIAKCKEELNRAKEANKNLLDLFKIEIDKSSKETAEKILKWLDNNCVFGGFDVVKTWFKEQFGAEIKEN